MFSLPTARTGRWAQCWAANDLRRYDTLTESSLCWGFRKTPYFIINHIVTLSFVIQLNYFVITIVHSTWKYLTLSLAPYDLLPLRFLARTTGWTARSMFSLQRRHNERDGVSKHQPHDRLLNRLFRRRSMKTSKLCVTGLCAGNSPVTGEFPAKGSVTRTMLPFDEVVMLPFENIADTSAGTVGFSSTMHYTFAF